MSKQFVSSFLQSVGLACAVVAGAIVDVALGFAVAAVALVVVGVAVERD